jgi:hypothetical protein
VIPTASSSSSVASIGTDGQVSITFDPSADSCATPTAVVTTPRFTG